MEQNKSYDFWQHDTPYLVWFVNSSKENLACTWVRPVFRILYVLRTHGNACVIFSPSLILRHFTKTTLLQCYIAVTAWSVKQGNIVTVLQWHLLGHHPQNMQLNEIHLHAQQTTILQKGRQEYFILEKINVSYSYFISLSVRKF